MAMDPTPTANLEVIHPYLIFGQLKASLDRPAGKSGSEQVFQSSIIRTWQHIRDKILDLIRIENVTSYN